MTLIVNPAPAELALHDPSQDRPDAAYPDALSLTTIRPVRPPPVPDPNFPHPPVHCKEWDPGAPAVRDVVAPAIGRDGTIDGTTLAGARTVTFDLFVIGGPERQPDGSIVVRSAYHWIERLAALTRPSARPWLYINRGTEYGAPWRLALRGNPFSISYARPAATRLELRLIFAAPAGYFEERDVRALDSQGGYTATGGLVMPFIHAFDFGHSSGAPGGLAFTVGGTLPVEPTVIIFGPVDNPTVALDDGQRFSFANLSLEAGQSAHIDMAAGTVTLNNQPQASLYHTVDWTDSTFWRMQPGANRLQLQAAGGRARIQWRDRRLTI
jgi:hypothetical protein